ncbi:DNA-directed RNA polymerase III subunit RPC9 [Spathaspora sp. JA1]|nr:DNA-directed RNA polymerase III subunit RPC9 [Spathaspora sp. JA1]
MQILKERDCFLSNYEVAQHLKGIKKKYNWTFTEQDEQELQKDKRGNRNKRFTACGLNLEVITKEVLSYVEHSPSGAITTDDHFKQLVKYLNQFELMKVEKLQIVNNLPRSMVTLYSLVEECDQRFNEDICQGILDKINELFPLEEEEEEEEQEADEEIAEEEDEESSTTDANI